MIKDLTKKLDIKTSVIQAPIAAISTLALVAVVSNTGDLGLLSVGAMDAAEARSAIEEIREKTSCPFNINVFCHESPIANSERNAQWLKILTTFFDGFVHASPTELEEIYLSFNQNEAMLGLFLEERPPVISFYFGLPSLEYIAALKKAGITLIASTL